MTEQTNQTSNIEPSRSTGASTDPETQPAVRTNAHSAPIASTASLPTQKFSPIAISGIEGSFAHIAASRVFPDREMKYCHSFKEAYAKVVDGTCDAAVLPIENSYAGEVGQVSDLMFSGDLLIRGVYELSVSHCLLGVPGSTQEDIKQVISHPQALEQCAEYIAQHGWSTTPYENTARAAREVSRRGDAATGAIASAETAQLYGLSILAENINESNQNTTRFAVFYRKDGAPCYAAGETEADVPGAPANDASAPTPPTQVQEFLPQQNNSILIFTIKHVAGSLAKAISIVGQHNYNMRVIRSRPVKDINWQYYFYIELEGRLDSPSGETMLRELKSACELIKVIGTYQPDVAI